MPSDEERLVVLLEARIRDFEKNMKKASGTADRSYGRMRRDSRSATRQMETDMVRSTSRINQALASTTAKIGVFAKAFAIGAIGGGLTEFIHKVREANANVADLSAEAKRAGISFEAFQELSYAAQKSQVSVDALTDGLKEMQLRADEFIRTGKGSGAESFQRLGYDAASLAEALKQPDQMFEDIIGKLSKLNTAARIRIADEIFGGTGGEQFVQLLDQGVEGIRKARQEARDLDLVLSDDLAVSAVEVNDRFNNLQATLSKNVTEAMVKVGSVAVKLADGPLGTLATKLQTLDEKARSLFGFLSRFSLNDELYGLLTGGAEGTGTDTGVAAIERRLELLAKQRENLKELGFDTADVEKQIADARAQLSHVNSTSGPNGSSSPAFTLPPITVKPGDGGGGGGGAPVSTGGGGSRADAFERLVRRMAESTDRINAVTEAQSKLNPMIDDFGRAAAFASAKQELLNAALQAGKQDTPALREEIDKIAGSYADATAKANMLTEAQHDAMENVAFQKDLVRGALSDINNAWADGKITVQEWGDIALNVLDKVINKIEDDLVNALFKAGNAGGGGGGFLGSLFGGLGSLFGGGGGFTPFEMAFSALPGLWAEGGRIRGPGTGTSDSIPAMLSDGEFVVKSAIVRKPGVLSMLESLNKGVLGFADGGLVKRSPAVMAGKLGGFGDILK